jgi:Uncharacterised nucleotidyltransferase
VAWVLGKAFGSEAGNARAEAPAVRPADAMETLQLARRLGLSARIAARAGRDSLAADLGTATAAEFLRDRAAIVARTMLLRETVRGVSAVAAAAALPIVLLKFAALDASGVLREGSRPAGDIDILVSMGRDEQLVELLRSGGFREMESPGYEHHRPALLGKYGVVELHRVILGVRLGSSRESATLEQLASAGLLRSLPHLPEPCSVPVPAVLAAHALVHGLGQHGFAPAAYPLATLFADLQDLGLVEVAGETMVERVAGWLQKALPRAEIAAARDLVVALSAGELPTGHARVLLDHLLAGTLDSDYVATLKLRQFRYPLSDRPPLAAALAELWEAIRGPRHDPPAVRGGRPRSGPRRVVHLLRRVLRALPSGPGRRLVPRDNPQPSGSSRPFIR